MKGFIHNYTGPGKGKTTSSLGLALRALGAGKRVLFMQFLKNGEFSEIKALKKIKSIWNDQLFFIQAGAERELFSEIKEKDRIAAIHGEEQFFNFLDKEAFDLYILDELNTAVHYKLINPKKFTEKLKIKHLRGDVVITGRYAPEEFLEIADLVSYIENKKHYADKGIPAREGIEY